MNSHAAQWVGQTVGQGQYRLDRWLRDGRSSSVFAGVDCRTGQPVLIRLALPGGNAAAFHREFHALQQLVPPGVAPLIAAHWDAVPFLVQALCPGDTLRGRMRAGRWGAQPVEALGRWLPGLAQTLDYLHQRGCAHGDINPDGVRLDEKGVAVLDDLGLAWPFGTGGYTTFEQAASGISTYLAPEQVASGRMHRATDQFALAAMVYEWLTGNPPFVGASAEEVARAHRRAPVPLAQTRPDLPIAVWHVLAQALTVNPDHRLSSCGQFADDLLRAAGGGGGAPPTRADTSSGEWDLPVDEPAALPQPPPPTVVAPPAAPAVWPTPPAPPPARTEPTPLAAPWRVLGVLHGVILVLLLAVSVLAGGLFLPDALGRNREPAPPGDEPQPPQASAELEILKKEKATLAERLKDLTARHKTAEDGQGAALKEKGVLQTKLNQAEDRLKEKDTQLNNANAGRRQAEEDVRKARKVTEAAELREKKTAKRLMDNVESLEYTLGNAKQVALATRLWFVARTDLRETIHFEVREHFWHGAQAKDWTKYALVGPGSRAVGLAPGAVSLRLRFRDDDDRGYHIAAQSFPSVLWDKVEKADKGRIGAWFLLRRRPGGTQLEVLPISRIANLGHKE